MSEPAVSYERARRVIDQIAALDVPAGADGMHRISREQAEQIAGFFEGDSALFWHLDTEPGRYPDYDTWHWRLRQARNFAVGRKPTSVLFGRLQADQAAAARH